METHMPSCIARLAKPFFILEAHGPQGTAGRVAVPEPSSAGGGIWYRGHAAAPEPSLAGRGGPEQWATWQH
jgi:hypothetical protein